jgi:biopolymer transport protein ExbD
MALKQRQMAVQEGEPLVPILNLVCMLIPLLLYGAVFVRYSTLDVANQGPAGPPPTEPSEQLGLTVSITERGFHIKVNPAHRLSWMNREDGPQIPKSDDGWNYAALNERLSEVKRAADRETRIFLVAEDDIPFQVLIRTMDYARGDDDELFPDVILSRGVV